MLRAPAFMGALVVFAAANMAGAQTVTRAYVEKFAQVSTDAEVRNFVAAIDTAGNGSITHQVALTGREGYNVSIDLAGVKYSKYNDAVYKGTVSHEMLDLYRKETDPLKNTLPDNSPGYIPGTGALVNVGSCNNSVDKGKVDVESGYNKNSYLYIIRVIPKAAGAGDPYYLSIESDPETANMRYRSYLKNCLPAPLLNQWINTKGYSDSEVAKLGRVLIPSIVDDGSIPEPITIGPSYKYAGEVCTTTDCGTAPSGGSGGGTTPSTSTPACTQATGVTSGNPYDCAPESEETKCKIIDVFCAIKKSLVPSDDFMKNGYAAFAADSMKLPVRRVEKISIPSTSIFIGKDLTIDFTIISDDNPIAKNMLRLIAWYQVFFWSLNFLGFPNPFRPSATNIVRETFRSPD